MHFITYDSIHGNDSFQCSYLPMIIEMLFPFIFTILKKDDKHFTLIIVELKGNKQRSMHKQQAAFSEKNKIKIQNHLPYDTFLGI